MHNDGVQVLILRVWRERDGTEGGTFRAVVIDVATRERRHVGSWEALSSLLLPDGPGAPVVRPPPGSTDP